MKAIGKWVLIKQDETITASGLTISSLNIGEIISTTSKEFQSGNKVYFNKRNAIEIEEYLLVTIDDIYVVIE